MHTRERVGAHARTRARTHARKSACNSARAHAHPRARKHTHTHTLNLSFSAFAAGKVATEELAQAMDQMVAQMNIIAHTVGLMEQVGARCMSPRT
eukprot:3557658-Pleurochrysis_carterae.AAC.1